MRDAFVATLLDLAAADPSVHLITGDLGFGVLKPFWERFPGQFTNAGIAEQNMTSFAAGMALEGKTVFTYSIGNFPTLRALEQIRNDCAYHEANVKIVCVGGGFVYGSLGMSHHATEDLAVMRALPGVTVLAPADAVEARVATRAIYEHHGTAYLRLGRGREQVVHHDHEPESVKGALPIHKGERVAILTTGAIVDEVLEARALLASHGVRPAVLTFPTVKPLDEQTVREYGATFPILVTVEEHNILGGFGGAVSEVVASMRGPHGRVVRIGIQDRYSSVVGSQRYLRDVYGMSATKIVDRILAELAADSDEACSRHA